MKSSFKRSLSTYLKILAILIAVIGQALIAKSWVVTILLWLIAVGLLIFSVSRTACDVVPKITVNPLPSETFTRWGILSGILALGLGVVSFGLFATPMPNDFSWVVNLTSLVYAILAVTVFCSPRRRQAPKGARWSGLEIAALVGTFVLATALRFYRLTKMPYGLWYDEADEGLNALQIFSTPGNLPVFAQSTQLAAHLIYLIAIAIKIFGQNIFSIRVISALFGVGTIAAAYLVGRELFNRKMGIILAFFFAVCRWDLVWSHIGMHGVTVPFFELLSFGLLLRALRLQRYRDYLFAGLALGLGLCFYVSFRLFPLVVLLLLALLWITYPDFIKRSYRHLLVFVFGAFIISAPVSAFAVAHSDEFLARTNQVSIFNDKTFQESMDAVLKSTGQHVLMFNEHGDNNGRHNIPGEPMLDTITAGLFILGIGLCLYKIKQPVSVLMLCWLFLMLAPGIFSLDFEAPQSYRSIGSMPAALVLAALPVNALLEDRKKAFSREISTPVLVAILLVLFLMGNLNAYNYFIRESINSDSWAAHSTPETIIAREIVRLGDQPEYYICAFYVDTPTINYLAPTLKDHQVLQTQTTFPLLMDGRRDAVFFIDPDRTMLYDQLKRFYPNALFQEFKNPGGGVVLYEAHIPTSEIQSIQGLTVRYYSNPEMTGTPFMTAVLRQPNVAWTEAVQGKLPFSVDVSGVLFADVYGNYQIKLEAPANAALYLDGAPVLQGNGSSTTAGLELAKGAHSIEVKASGAYGSLRLSWQPPEKEWELIPSVNLFLPPVTNNGLLGTFYPNDHWAGTPAFKEIDPYIQFYYHNPPLPRPYTVEWVGRIKIEKPGVYEFGTESIDDSQIWIDDDQVVNNHTPNVYVSNQIELSAGFHKIKLRYADRTGYTHVNLFWKPPEGDQQPIPSAVLFLP
jgi:hypothetical protein